MNQQLSWKQVPLHKSLCHTTSLKRRCARLATRNKAAAAENEIATGLVAVDGSTSQARLVGFEDGVYTVEGALLTSASTSLVWDVLTDYERLSEVFSNIKSSRIVSREPELILHQDCKWEFMVFSGKFATELSVQEDLQAMALTFNLIRSSFMRSFVGEWQVKPQQAGTLIQHRLTVEPLVSAPAIMTGYTRKIFVRQVASLLQDLQEEMERHSSEDFSYYDL